VIPRKSLTLLLVLSIAARADHAAASLPEADVQVQMAADSLTFPGGALDVALRVLNFGPSVATNVLVRMNVPAGTTFQSLAASSTYTYHHGDVYEIPANVTVRTPAAGGTGAIWACVKALGVTQDYTRYTAYLRVTLAVDALAPQGSTVTATATSVADRTVDELAFCPPSTSADPVAENDTATTATIVNGPADVLTCATDAPDPVAPGDKLTYTIQLTNTGPKAANNVILREVADSYATFFDFSQLSGPEFTIVSAPPPGAWADVRVQAATLPADTSAVFQLIVVISANAPDGLVLNIWLTATSDTYDPNLSNNYGCGTKTTITAKQ